ncbi:MAG: hypothetical protein V4582_13890 [Pseudomonadota bacterium]
MAKLSLEFIRRPVFPWLGLGAVMLMGLVCANLIVAWIELGDEVKSKQERLVALELKWKQRQSTLVMKDDVAALAMQQRRADERKIVDALRYPWNRILAIVEQASDDKVAILALTHEQGVTDTQVAVEAADVAALLRFVANMNEIDDDPGGARWYLANYQTQTQNNPLTVKGLVLARRGAHL